MIHGPSLDFMTPRQQREWDMAQRPARYIPYISIPPSFPVVKQHLPPHLYLFSTKIKKHGSDQPCGSGSYTSRRLGRTACCRLKSRKRCTARNPRHDSCPESRPSWRSSDYSRHGLAGIFCLSSSDPFRFEFELITKPCTVVAECAESQGCISLGHCKTCPSG
jgi:hypothetical protein